MASIKNKRVEAPDEDCCCGNCSCFHDEDAEGVGFCHEHASERSCEEWCDRWDDAESWEARVKMKNIINH